MRQKPHKQAKYSFCNPATNKPMSSIAMKDAIRVFYEIGTRSCNDQNNKLRESIISDIINSKIPEEFYQDSRWSNLKDGLFNYIGKITNGEKLEHVECKIKAGRKYNYDFELIVNRLKNYHVEFKYNAERISDLPQFANVSKVSRYLSNNFESYFYDNYLQRISEMGQLALPEKAAYLKQVHGPKPKCMMDFKNKYYAGCSRSSQCDHTTESENFYNFCNEVSREAINNYISSYDLNSAELTNYLSTTQQSKVYMLYKDGKFYAETINADDFEIVECERVPSKYVYVARLANGHRLRILLRWKNGNGIAFPGLQIKFVE